MEFIIGASESQHDKSRTHAFFAKTYSKIGYKLAKKPHNGDLNLVSTIPEYWCDTPMTSHGSYDVFTPRTTPGNVLISSPLTPQSIRNVPDLGVSPVMSDLNEEESPRIEDCQEDPHEEAEAQSPISISSLMNGFHQAEASAWEGAKSKRRYSDIISFTNAESKKCLKKRKWSDSMNAEVSSLDQPIDSISNSSCFQTKCRESHITEEALQDSLMNCALEEDMDSDAECSTWGNLCYKPDPNKSQASFDPETDLNTFSFIDSPVPNSPRKHQVMALNKLSPIEQVQHDTKCFEGADAVFTVAMDRIMCKMIIALGDPESVYLFRDFAGHFTTFLDRFGPGGYDSHRAPNGAAWMLKLLLPWTFIDDDAKPCLIAVYEEVNGWIRNITRFINPKHSDAVFKEGIWDSCVEHMASANVQISDIAYHTAKVIVTTLPFDHEIICRVLLLRNITFGYEDSDMSNFRNSHIRLLNKILERIDNLGPQQQTSQHKDFVTEINGELERLLANEPSAHVQRCIRQCLDYAGEVYRSMDIMTCRDPQEVAKSSIRSLRAPRLSLNFDHWSLSSPEKSESQSEIEESEEDKGHRGRRWHRFTRKIHRIFGHWTDKNSSNDASDMSRPQSSSTIRISAPQAPYQKNWSNEEFNLEEVWCTKSLPL